MLFCSTLITLFVSIVSMINIRVYRTAYEAVADRNTLTNDFVSKKAKEYNKVTGIFFLIIAFVIFPVSCFSLATAIYFPFTALLQSLFSNVIYSTYPVFVYWLCIPCLFLSFSTCAVSLILMSYIRFGKDEYLNYLCYEYVVFFERKQFEIAAKINLYQFNEHKIREKVRKTLKENLIVFISIAVLVCLISVSFVNTTCVFGRDFIQIGFLREYTINDIENVYFVEEFRAPAGNVVSEPYYVVEFKDGYVWNDRNKHAGFDVMADYLQSQYGIEITFTEFYGV